MVKSVNIGVVGTGLVGSCFLRQLSPIAESFHINVVAISRLGGALVSKDYSPLPVSADFEPNTDAISPQELAEFLAKSPVAAVLVDNTANQELALSYPLFTTRGVSIVTPNKKAFSAGLDLWEKLQNPTPPALVYHESTVGAGLPVISSVKDLVITGDKIHLIEGILSGTLSYIFNEFSKDDAPAFSEIVKVAKQKGYTEPDPREDLNGLDVARKVTILARLAGLPVESPSSFPVESLIPKPLESVASVAEFLQKLPDFDAEIQKRKETAKANGKVLRFVGQVKVPTGEVSVGIREYDVGHPFASLTGADNIVSFTTQRYPSPLIIQGAGAGDEVTAMGVLADLIKIVQRIA